MKLSLVFLCVFLTAVCLFGGSEASEEGSVRVSRANSRPYLPRPRPRPVVPNYRPRRASCSTSLCRAICKSRHPSYSGRCINGRCDCS
ncbi:hypothetical protein NQ317_014612 [Molorchus minor]|uniref:Defensin n=1 Tax=Molorchus minor TaxID=1323400 RepID=A0ABQ9JLZ5_9CUCU|nr:hypothetical protein NQ317_014612 [Molorchus minor]